MRTVQHIYLPILPLLKALNRWFEPRTIQTEDELCRECSTSPRDPAFPVHNQQNGYGYGNGCVNPIGSDKYGNADKCFGSSSHNDSGYVNVHGRRYWMQAFSKSPKSSISVTFQNPLVQPHRSYSEEHPEREFNLVKQIVPPRDNEFCLLGDFKHNHRTHPFLN
jgi:hypothetical protein